MTNNNIPENEKPMISSKAKIVLARIRDMNQDGLSGKAMLRRFRGQITEADKKKYPKGVNLHIQISDAEFWKTKRMAGSWQENARKVKFSRNDRVIPNHMYGMTPFNMTRGRFQHIVRIDGRTQDGEKTEKFVTISSSTELTKNQIYAGVDKILENDLNAYNFVISRGIKFVLKELYQTT